MILTAAANGAGLPLAAVLADPNRARAAALGLETVSLTTPGGKTVSAALAAPGRTPAPAVLLVHEWWGLNDQIKAVAAELADEGYLALPSQHRSKNSGSEPTHVRNGNFVSNRGTAPHRKRQ